MVFPQYVILCRILFAIEYCHSNFYVVYLIRVRSAVPGVCSTSALVRPVYLASTATVKTSRSRLGPAMLATTASLEQSYQILYVWYMYNVACISNICLTSKNLDDCEKDLSKSFFRPGFCIVTMLVEL